MTFLILSPQKKRSGMVSMPNQAVRKMYYSDVPHLQASPYNRPNFVENYWFATPGVFWSLGFEIPVLPRSKVIGVVTY